MRLLVAALALTSTAALAGPPVYIPPPPPPPEPAKPAEPPKPVKVRLLVMDLKSSEVDKATVSVLQGIVATGLAEYPELDVVSGDDVKQLVQLQAERQTMGCSDDAGCLAEIADALGAKLVVFGNVGKLDNSLVLNLNLFDSQKAVGLGRIVIQSDNTKSIPKKLKPKLRDLVGKWYGEHNMSLPPVVEEKPEPTAPVAQVVDPGPWPWVTAGAGVVLLAGGAAAAAVVGVPMLGYTSEAAKAQALQKKIQAGTSVSAAAVTAEQSALLNDTKTWNSYGFILFDVAAPVAAAGAVLTGVGVTWIVSAPGGGS
jgi:hypothetical protein